MPLELSKSNKLFLLSPVWLLLRLQQLLQAKNNRSKTEPYSSVSFDCDLWDPYLSEITTFVIIQVGFTRLPGKTTIDNQEAGHWLKAIIAPALKVRLFRILRECLFPA